MKIKRKVLLLFLSLNIVSILLVLLPFTSDYAKAIGAGNFNTQKRNDTNDEIGILTSQFQEMNTSIKNLTANE